jgi:hypothetical protein
MGRNLAHFKRPFDAGIVLVSSPWQTNPGPTVPVPCRLWQLPDRLQPGSNPYVCIVAISLICQCVPSAPSEIRATRREVQARLCTLPTSPDISFRKLGHHLRRMRLCKEEVRRLNDNGSLYALSLGVGDAFYVEDLLIGMSVGSNQILRRVHETGPQSRAGPMKGQSARPPCESRAFLIPSRD